MATLLVKLKVKPGMEARYEEIQADLYQKTHDLEKGIVRAYEAWRGEEEGTYYCLLSYDTYYSFMKDHQTSPHHEDATPPLLDCFAAESIEWLDPVGGASPLPPTNPETLPAEASDLIKTYDAGMGFKLPAWWSRVRAQRGA
ncbi:MAG: putative quinol monooxygenase [Dehalococcoidia bacterium]